jgi:hypothetical protein
MVVGVGITPKPAKAESTSAKIAINRPAWR